MATFNPDWSRVLAGVGQGLMSAGQPGSNLGNFGTGLMQGTQNYDQGVDRKRGRELEDIRLELMKQQQEQQRLANTKAAQEEAALQQLINGGGGIQTASAPNGMSQAQFGGAPTAPAQGGQPFFDAETQARIQALPPSLQRAAVEAQLGNMFAAPAKDKWEIKTVRVGNQDITYRINPATGEREELGSGSAFAPSQAQDNVSLTPFYTQDAQGNVQMWQPSRTGEPVRVQLPEGFQPTKPLSFQDLGTSIVGLNPLGGGQQVAMPKDVAGEAAQKQVGEATGKVAAGLPDAVAKAEEASALINSLKTHPGRKLATGATSYLPAVAGTDAKDFSVKLDQLKGTVFLQAYSQLKGGGAITETEGLKAEQAIARLNTAQSEGQFVKALDELNEVISAGISRMKQRAGSPVATPEDTSGAPAIGSVDGGYRFKGGNPADPGSWEKVN
jgi:hypothetical protein